MSRTEADIAKNTVIRNGMMYHKLTKELYKQHKSDGWTDRRIRDRYGMHIQKLTDWKRKNFTKKEIDEMSLTGLHSKKTKESGEKRKLKKDIEVTKNHIKELDTRENNTNYDPVEKPAHYHKNGIDVIGFSEMQFDKSELKGFYRVNVLKYVTRYDRKNGIEDLRKSQFYLKKLIELEGEE